MNAFTSIGRALDFINNNPIAKSLFLHSLVGYAVVVTLSVFWSQIYIAAAFAALTAAKEYLFDTRYETPPQPIWGATVDWTGGLLGAVLALVAKSYGV